MARSEAGREAGMKITAKEVTLLSVGGITVGLLAYLAFTNGGGQITQPATEPERLNIFAGLDSLAPLTKILGNNHARYEWRRPDYDMEDNASVVTLPVRYPYNAGANLNAIIHHGWSALNRPAPHDADWLECPPGEVTL
jgi:hypothetical protein